jgi:CRISPR/Cas system endoribonuclease Cas6 (RAMP superfamily)
MEGCWMEMAPKQGAKSVRVTFGDHAFFIPLNAAGMKVRAQGSFKTKTLTKEHVDHLINEDGAKFDNRNADGSVTEVSFDATGVELTKS